MKKNIHPQYFSNAMIQCACGAKYKVGSTVPKMQVEICAKCHPFFTGRGEKLIDKSGRVERFKKRAEKTAVLKTKALKDKIKAAKKTSKKKK